MRTGFEFQDWLELGEEDGLLCKMCMEPITTSVCVDCLRKNVRRLVGGQSNKLVKEFDTFHEAVVDGYSTFKGDSGSCIKCRGSLNVAVCPHCYINEMVSWAKKRNGLLAKTIQRYFKSYIFDTSSVQSFIQPTEMRI
jgi:hypothetical protein